MGVDVFAYGDLYQKYPDFSICFHRIIKGYIYFNFCLFVIERQCGLRKIRRIYRDDLTNQVHNYKLKNIFLAIRR